MPSPGVGLPWYSADQARGPTSSRMLCEGGGGEAPRGQRFAGGPAEGVGGAWGLRYPAGSGIARGLTLGQGGEAKHVPASRLGAQQPAGQVVLVPAGHDQHDGAAGPDAGAEGAAVPVVHAVAHGLGLGLLPVLVGVVDDAEHSAVTGDGPAHARGQESAAVRDRPGSSGRRRAAGDVDRPGQGRGRPGCRSGRGPGGSCTGPGRRRRTSG